MITCIEHEPSVYIESAGRSSASASRVEVVRYRVDEKPLSTSSFSTSSDGLALGLWSGARVISFIKDLFGGMNLHVWMKAPGGSTGVDFKIENIDKAIKPISNGM